MKTVLIVNPHAGRQVILRELAGVKKVFEEGGREVAVHETETAEKAAQIIKNAVKEKPECIVCCGGDGTLSETVDTVIRSGADVPLGYIPAGSTNDFASSLGIPKDPAEAARFILAHEPRPLDVGRFNDRQFIYVASFGAFTHSSYSTDQSMKNALGHFAYLLEGVKELGDFKSYRVKAETAEGETFRGEYFFGAVSNSTSFGGVMKISGDKVDFNDGMLELMLIKTPYTLADFNKIVISLLTGDYDSDVMVFTHTKQVKFTCEDKMPWSLDGEYDPGGEKITIKTLHNAIRLHY